ncbi:MAG: FeoB-associated Cys-rich membrane protein [Mogibacterium sp.]|nr:FeoB-associated Cys-rich membrane protein [Mogibacterium sp.]
MNAATAIAIIVIVTILFFAARYIYKEKKKGNACIGCPYADSCPKHRQNEAACCGNALHQKADTH